MTDTQFERTTRSYTQHILAPVTVVFPLLCPVREAEWLEDFHYDMIHSDSGVAEEGCVFRTQAPGGPETIWMIVQHNRQKGVIEFVRITAGLVATRLEIRLAKTAENSTSVHITYSFTPTSEEGVVFVNENHSESAFRNSMAWWEKSMNHFIETGKQLQKCEMAEA